MFLKPQQLHFTGIGGIGKLGEDEFLPWHRIDGAQHRLVADAAPAQREQKLHAVDALVAPRLFHIRRTRLCAAAPGKPAPVLAHLKTAASRVMNGSSVRSSRSAVTEMRLFAIAERSVPSRGLGRSLRANASQ